MCVCVYILGYVKDLLHILGPVWGLAQGHKPTVGQDSEHDNHAEQCEVSCQGNSPDWLIQHCLRVTPDT